MKYISSFCLFLFMSSLFAQDISSFFKNLEPSDIKELVSNQSIIRTVKNIKDISLIDTTSSAEELHAVVKSVRPNYMSELIAVLDDTENTLLDSLYASLMDFPSYVGMPYYSVQNNVTVDLFSKMDVLVQEYDGYRKKISALMNMDPFTDYRVEIHCGIQEENGHRTLFYSVSNTDVMMYYGKVAAVQKGKKLWLMYAVEKDKKLFVYGFGAMNAFDMFGIARARLEVSLVGRVNAFFNSIIKRTMSIAE